MVKLFRNFALLTVSTVLLLIFVGGVVRATGSGMGCPDWPKCFGMWVPPTHVSELPINYQNIYGAKLKGEVIFNPVKTWIEYINRLLGALTGVFIFITLIFSYFTYWKLNRSIVLFSFLAFLLVGFEGWLGSKVVSSELHPELITIHMLLSLVILGILIMVALKSYKLSGLLNYTKDIDKPVSFLVIISIIFLTGQIYFGTQIREGIDINGKLLGENLRSSWLDSHIGKVYFHIGLALIILMLQFIIYRKLKLGSISLLTTKWSGISIIFTCLSIISGYILAFLGLPAFIQPFHLLLSVLIITSQFIVYFMIESELI